MAKLWPLLKGSAQIGGAVGGATYGALDQYKDEPWVGRLRDIMHPPKYTDYPEDPRIGGYRMGQTVEPAPDEAAMAQDAREVAARRVRGELAPSAAVERRFGTFAEPSAPPGPSRDEAFQMGGLAEMGDYKEAPATVWRDTDVAGAERDVAPDPYMNPFAASPQQTRVARAHAGPVDALLIPTSPTDLALMSLGPAGKVAGVPGKVAAMTAGLMASGIDPAEAGVLGKASGLLRGKPGGPWEGGIRAYHSSPYDFDKFDWSKLRTGEGANTFGAGFYAAENPAVSGQGGQYWQQFLNRFGGSEGNVAKLLAEKGFDREQALKAITDQIERAKAEPTTNMYGPTAKQSHIDLLLGQQRRLESGAPVGPRTYEVNINARPELLLDWDKPLKDQPQREALIDIAGRRKDATPTAMDMYQGLVGDPFSPAGYSIGRSSGGDFYRAMQLHNRDPSVSQTLADAGIPGIRYLDQGSRQTAADMRKAQGWPSEISRLETIPQTYNYVVTDPSKLDILAKYGVVGTAGGGMAALAAQDEYQR